ncbi:RidA family protein [Solicola gregarius]|uniref:RidA family protein n=1 Tax=Solicola gregarius TaxID=2908642 RepID=A0AA46TGR9_9ACTN|nr:RidA family protein [Solicola gregarius]UYM04850.1 RidA family protein [Solicola gregarius]
MIEYFERPAGLGPTNGYSHAVGATGRFVAVSGQLPTDEDGHLVSSKTREQADRVFANLATALRAASAGPEDLFTLTYYLVDLADLPEVRAARDEFFGDLPRPASSLVQVAGLVLPDARLEIDATAVVSA